MIPIFGVIFGIIIVTTVGGSTLLGQQAEGARIESKSLPASSVTSGENVYIVWASNKTGIPDVMFRASTDGDKPLTIRSI